MTFDRCPVSPSFPSYPPVRGAARSPGGLYLFNP